MFKQYLFLLLFALFQFQAIGQCPTGDVVLLSQDEVDNFIATYPNCADLPGWLSIGTPAAASDITDLSGLSQLESIGSNLELLRNEVLTSLQGLENISSVGGALSILDQSNLTSLQGLQNLSSIGAGIVIDNNPGLTDLQGLNSLSAIPLGIDVTNNALLTSLEGLENVTSIGGTVLILSNPVLSSLAGLDELQIIGGPCAIVLNDGLTNIAALSNLQSIGGGLNINSNPSLTALQGLNSLLSLGGGLWIEENDLLLSLAGIQNIDPDDISSLRINNNPLLATCQVSNICVYLNNPDSIAEISGNATTCADRTAVEEACIPLNVTNIANTAIHLYPNPTRGPLAFENSIATQITLFNAQGQRVAHYTTPSSTLDISPFPRGVYHLYFFVDNQPYSARVVKVD